ncbi:MAG: MarR family transcriptional regulator [Methanobrevibacter sp.]|nr:MarR family transcriptional regulator [Methanobrevibacter sp.]
MQKNNINDFDDNSPLGGILFILHKNQHKYLNDSLVKYDLNIIQALFILRINKYEGLSQKDLAETFYLTKGSVAKSLKVLEEKNLVKREKLDGDKRKYSLKLTEEGEKLIPIIQKVNRDWEEKMRLYELNNDFMETLKDLTSKAIKLNQDD